MAIIAILLYRISLKNSLRVYETNFINTKIKIDLIWKISLFDLIFSTFIFEIG